MFAVNISTQNLSLLHGAKNKFLCFQSKDENSVAAQNIPHSLSHLLGGMDSGE